MFITAQFKIAKCWKHPKCPSVNQWIKKLWYIYTMEYYTAERKRELLPFTTAWMELESILLSEICQAVKGKYHMISSLSGTWSTKQTSKQNITRDTEIKKKLTVTRGEEEAGYWGKRGEGPSENMYKGHIDKAKRGRF